MAAVRVVLPLVLVELKNPADKNADLWKAYDQIDTYKEQIPDIFQYNEILVISDGSEARMGSLSANAERFMAWRTIDGLSLDPLGHFNEFETMIRGVLNPVCMLDFLRFFVYGWHCPLISAWGKQRIRLGLCCCFVFGVPGGPLYCFN